MFSAAAVQAHAAGVGGALLQLRRQFTRQGRVPLSAALLQLLGRGPPCLRLPSAAATGSRRDSELQAGSFAMSPRDSTRVLRRRGPAGGIPVALLTLHQPAPLLRAAQPLFQDAAPRPPHLCHRLRQPAPVVAGMLTPDVPDAVAVPHGECTIVDWGDRPHLLPLVVIRHSAELQNEELGLGRVLVAVVGGTRPAVSVPMVTSFLFVRFSITSLDVEVRRHDPEDFIVRFWHQEDRDRVLASRPAEALLPLVWRPW